MTATPRPLRRLRCALALLAVLTAMLIAGACRAEALARTVAALAAVGCLVAWLVLLDVEGRTAARLEARAHRRAAHRRHGRSVRSRPPSGPTRRVA
ncbi:hypothetical protein [Cognatilysobacter terrigena]|uniref:hypothetical protein n=1 Tax=Cognatilysobacter terrigena TaxID=2488749 RepID=UPI00105C2731|nr:hypothetical protein [Lysobacter terrigena]